jgi:hypothetical protein
MRVNTFNFSHYIRYFFIANTAINPILNGSFKRIEFVFTLLLLPYQLAYNFAVTSIFSTGDLCFEPTVVWGGKYEAIT